MLESKVTITVVFTMYSYYAFKCQSIYVHKQETNTFKVKCARCTYALMLSSEQYRIKATLSLFTLFKNASILENKHMYLFSCRVVFYILWMNVLDNTL